MLAVLPVPEGPEGLFPPRRRDVQALARLQIDPRREHMDVDAAFRVPVLDGAPGVPVRLQPGPGGLLELLEHFPDLPIRRVILRRPGDHAGGARVRELQGVGHGLDLGRIADQNLDALPLPALGVLLSGQVLRRSSSPAAEANHHRGGSSTPANVRISRRNATRCAMTWTASAPPLWVLAQRAIWFRLLPIRANSTARRRLHRLRSERNINLSGWLRSLVTRELDRELGPEPVKATVPLPGWSPWSLDDDTWGARWQGNTRTLPADLVGRSIRITTRTGETWISTVKDVLHRDAASILVRDSGKG